MTIAALESPPPAVPSAGDELRIYFDVPTNRGAGAFESFAGVISCETACDINQAQAHRLFDFFGANGQRITTPFFHEYSTGWEDDSTFVITVINGTDALMPGILSPSYVPGSTAFADTATRVALRPGVVIKSLACPLDYIDSPYCMVPTLQAFTNVLTATTTLTDGTRALDSLPPLRGDFGRAGDGPRIVFFGADDPDNGGLCTSQPM